MQNLQDYRASRDLFLPLTPEDAALRYHGGTGGGPLDFILVTGDAYVDHPSFGAALLGRLLEDAGYSMGIIPQPDWRSAEDFRILGAPRLAFLVSAGNVDSMVANYTVSGKPRRQDAYSPGGIGGRRPDRATLVYCTRIREAWKNVDIVIGGIEASLRRLAHYDFWSDKLRRSMLLDSKADLLVYGMAERAILEIAERLDRGIRAGQIRDVRGTVWKTQGEVTETDGLKMTDLPDWDLLRDPRGGKHAYAESFREQQRNTDAINGRMLTERYGPTTVVQNPPALPLETEELDRLHELPFTRTFHPDYLPHGGVPAIEEVRFSLVNNRGCFGACTFCALTYHQGRRMQARSRESLLREARLLTKLPGFKGYIHDVGGPTANFLNPSCDRQLRSGVCRDRQCIGFSPCRELRVDHREYLDTLRALRALPGVKKVFVRSGLRFDYLLMDRDETFLRELCEHHISGRLKVAPEHIATHTLEVMGKPPARVFRQFQERYASINNSLGPAFARQQLVPYFISSHPGTTLADAVELAEYFRSSRVTPEQVQDFYPTPGTLATCMYYTGLDPRPHRGKRDSAMAPVHVARTAREKGWQRALLQFRDPRNAEKVREALLAAGRQDLIGWGPACLVGPAEKGRPERHRHRDRRRDRPRNS
ncbi:MAG: YgiQ family radical SAM protein [Spirochaetaceae bacterium]|nr:MAG: YgiQ family radical SAM protein [Spirochaetaceae bacterium]